VIERIPVFLLGYVDRIYYISSAYGTTGFAVFLLSSLY
jgi:hypothetical protein